MKRILTIFALSFFAISLSAQTTIIPKPQKSEIYQKYFLLDNNCVMHTNEKNLKNLIYLQEKLVKATGYSFKYVKQIPADKYIIFEENVKLDIPEEGYLLEVNDNGVTIKAKDGAGIFYGIQSLMQMLPPAIYSGNPTNRGSWSLPYIKIEDYPRFHYRGMMLDVSRTFFNYDDIIKYIDWLAYHKINKFHWHLTDDNGWRIEIKKYPELTAKGAWRGPDEVLSPAFGSGNKRYGGYYTQEQIKKIVA